MIPRGVLLPLVGFALMPLLAAIDAGAQAPAATGLYVVVLATVPTTAERPATPLPEALRGKSLYWRLLKSGNTVAYQLCLGFFEARNDAERARQQLAERFRDARVILVNSQERDNLEKALRAAKPGPPAPAATPPPPAVRPLAATPSPPLATTPPPPAPAGAAEALMAEGRGAIAREDYATATRAFTQLLALPDNSLRRDAQEFLALAYERRGDTARARLEYENYLKQFPEGEDSVRVRQRLTSLLAAPQMEALRAPAESTQGWRSNTNGSLSQFYYRGNSKIDSQQAGVVANTFDRTTLSLTDQSVLITNLDFSTRFLDDTHDNRMVFRDMYTRNYLSGQENTSRLSAAYYDYRYKPADVSARVGRQPGNSGGLPGRFDGALLGYGIAPKTRLNLAAGEPVDPGFDIDSTRRFFGINTEVGPLDQRWTGNVYVFRQTVDGIADREATGMEVRYFAPQGFFASTVDYDTLFRHTNIATMQGNWIAPSKTSFNFLLDYRMTPSLQTTTAVIGEATTSIQTLLNTYSEDELHQRARALTAESALAFAGVTHPVSREWQLGADFRVSRLSHTDGTNNFPATPGTGNVYALTGQAISTGLFATRDVNVFSVSRISAMTYSALSGQLTSRIPVGANWTLEGMVLWYSQDNDDGTTLRRISPTGRLSYRWRNSMTLELEGGVERTNTRSAILGEDTRRTFFSLGYRWDF